MLSRPKKIWGIPVSGLLDITTRSYFVAIHFGSAALFLVWEVEAARGQPCFLLFNALDCNLFAQSIETFNGPQKNTVKTLVVYVLKSNNKRSLAISKLVS